MVVLHRRLDLVIPGVLWVGLAVWPGPATWAADDPPPLEGPVVHPGDDRPVPPSLRGTGAAVHEAVQEPGSGASRVSVPREPPAPVAERPPATPPEPRAQWAAGYWAWDPARDHFAWVGGLWVVPPSNRVWVNGRWQRDARGWSRVPGFWSPRRERDVMLPAWRNGGPPAEHPLDVPGPAPSPESFYVPGHYAPEGPRMVWTPGFWARSQPGWDWVPARWVRRPEGWDFRAGYWTPEPDERAHPEHSQRHVVARPRSLEPPAASGEADEGLPPAIVESEPARPGAGAQTPPPDDPIAAREAAGPLPPVVVMPHGGRVPYPYIYPRVYVYPFDPGVYPPSGKLYDPYGYVGASVPPSIRRMLDRILP